MRLPLTDTDLFLSRAGGAVVSGHDDCLRIHSPDNLAFFHGNYLLLPQRPEVLGPWVDRARALFASVPEIRHVCLRWDGDVLAAEARREADSLGMSDDTGLSMIATAMHGPPAPGLTVRPLDPVSERDAIVALNIACDPGEQQGDAHYVAFKEGRRRAWWRWCAGGVGQWWGVFDADRLIGQCGMVRCPGGQARFQSVETHPDHRRRGACGTLIAAVGQHMLDQGSATLHLAADADGPARRLYRRLGFVEDGWQRSLLLGGGELTVRPAIPADLADVISLTRSAAPDRLAAVELALSTAAVWVASRSGTVHGVRVIGADGEEVVLACRPGQDGVAITAALREANNSGRDA